MMDAQELIEEALAEQASTVEIVDLPEAPPGSGVGEDGVVLVLERLAGRTIVVGLSFLVVGLGLFAVGVLKGILVLRSLGYVGGGVAIGVLLVGARIERIMNDHRRKGM